MKTGSETWCPTWESRREQARQELQSVEDLRARFEPLPEPGFRYEIVTGVAPRLIIERFTDLNAARDVLRAAFGAWEDRIHDRFFSCGRAFTTWHSTNGMPMELWFECRIEDYPAELQSNRCQWKMTENTGPQYEYVCSTESDAGGET